MRLHSGCLLCQFLPNNFITSKPTLEALGSFLRRAVALSQILVLLVRAWLPILTSDVRHARGDIQAATLVLVGNMNLVLVQLHDVEGNIVGKDNGMLKILQSRIEIGTQREDFFAVRT